MLLNFTDDRMLELINILKQDGHIKFQQTFLDTIGFLKQNVRNVRLGTQHFQGYHIQTACEAFNVNANWIMGLEENVYRGKVKETVKEMPVKRQQLRNIKK